MVRLLIFLVGMLSTRRPGAVSSRPARYQDDPDEDATWFLPPRPDRPLQPTREPRTMPFRPERVRRRPHSRGSARPVRRRTADGTVFPACLARSGP